MRIFLVIILVFSFSCLAKEQCLKGFSSSWSFDQKKKSIKLEEKKPSDVCNFIQAELKPNFEIKFFHKNKFVYSKKINWPELTPFDYEEKGELKGTVSAVIDHRIIKFPITLNLIDRYQVIHLTTGEVWGKGSIKL